MAAFDRPAFVTKEPPGLDFANALLDSLYGLYNARELGLAAAIAAANTASGVGVVDLPAGDYSLTAQLLSSATTPLWLRGAGADCTRIIASDGGLAGSQTEVLDFRNSSVRISGLTIDCGASAGVTTGIAIGADGAPVTDYEIDHCIIRGSKSAGISLRTDGRARINIHHNKFFPTSATAINTRDDAEFSWLSICDNEIDGDGCEGNGINIDCEGGSGSSEVIISRNKIRDFASNVGLAGAGDGIALSAITHGTVADNIVEDCGLDGIHMEGACRFIDVHDNQLTRCAGRGISLSGGSSEHNNKIKVHDNFVIDCGDVSGATGVGINLATSGAQDSLICTGNYVEGSGAASKVAYGISVLAENFICSHNIVKNTKGSSPIAILLTTCADGDVSHNRCFDDQDTPTQTYGLKLVGATTRVIVADNNFTGNVSGGIDKTTIGVETDLVVHDNFGTVVT